EEHLQKLAPICLVGSQEDAARELHRNRAAAFAAFAGQQVAHEGAKESWIVDAAVLKEVVVLGGEHRVDELGRDRIEGKGDAPLFPELRDELPVAAIDSQRNLKANVLDRGHVGERGAQVLIRAEQRQRHGPGESDERSKAPAERRSEMRSHNNNKA